MQVEENSTKMDTQNKYFANISFKKYANISFKK